MPSVCVCDCGLTVEDGLLCVDWTAVGADRVCATSNAYAATPPASAAFIPVWSITATWTNTTCRTHRAIVRADVPYVKLKMGGGNAWEVRMFIDGAINAAPPYTPARVPEALWSSNWYLAMPAGTDQESTAPGAAEVEFLVPPGATLNTVGLTEYRSINYTAQPQNRLEVAPLRLSIMAFPSKTDTGTGRSAC